MNDNEAVVRIVGDASQVAPAVETAKGEVAGLGETLASLNATMRDMTSQFTAGFAEINAQLAGTKDEMAAVEHETEREALSLREIALSAHEAVEGFNGMKAALSEIAEVWMAAFAVERIAEWAEEFAEAKEQVAHLAETFGMTTGQVQQLQGIATATGISLETITRGMQVMSRNAVQAGEGGSAMANAFKAVGISADDGRTSMERLEVVADKFKEMDDGPKKVALAMELLGRSGAQLIPVLNMGSEGLQTLTEKAQEYGVASTEVAASAQEKGVALAESINEDKLAWQGMTNVLGDAFAPVLKEITDSLNEVIKAMIDSYTEGGVVAAVFETIVIVVETVGAVINALAGIFAELWDAVSAILADLFSAIYDCFGVETPNATKASVSGLNILKDAFVVAKDVIIAAIEAIRGMIVYLIDYVRNLGIIARDALTLQWDKIDADWQRGTDLMARHVEDSVARIKKAMAEAGAAITAAMNGEALSTGATGVPEPKGGGSFDPELGKTPKATKEKKPKDDLVQQLDEELTAKKLAWAMEQDAQGTAQQYSLQSEADYWKAILDRTDLSVKDRGEIEKKYLAVHSEIVKQTWQIEEDGYKEQLAAADKNETAKLTLAQAHLAEVARMFGTESKEYAAAQAEIVKIKQAAEAQVRELTQLRSEAIDKAALDEITAAENVAKHRVAMGVETNDKLLAEERAFEDQRYAIQLAAAQRALTLANPNDPVKVAQAHAAIEVLEREHQAKLTQIDQQAQLQRTATERTAINSTAQLWGSNIAKLLTLQQGFAATVQGLYKGMVDVISTALASVIEKWLEQQIAALIFKRTAQSADGAATVTSNAAVAASAAFASTAAIPLVGPELAPAAAAAAFSATMAFAPIASAAGGFDIPFGVNPLVQAHAQEMILPASLAVPLRTMLTQKPANNNGPAPANDGRGGDTHNHFYGDIRAWDGASVKKTLMNNASHVAAAADHGVRQGYAPKNSR